MTRADEWVEVLPEQVAAGGRCRLSIIIDAPLPDPGFPGRLTELRDMLDPLGGEVIVTCPVSWGEAPPGVTTVVYPSAGQGDRHDAAARVATGELLAFTESQVRFRPGWAEEVLRAFDDDEEVLVAGGPVVPSATSRRERVSAIVTTRHLGRTPAAHNVGSARARFVREVGASNIVVRAEAFRSVGGFQAPQGGGAEAVRLCYKVRTILGGKIFSDPLLALSAPAAPFPGALLRAVGDYGRSRGRLARGMRDAAPLLPYALPSVLLVLGLATALLLGLAGGGAARQVLLGVGAILVVSMLVLCGQALRGQDRVSDRLLAGVSMPLVVALYGWTFLRGYLAKSTDDISPPREREAPLRVLILNWRDVTHPHSGGAETYMHQIAKRWAAQGMDVAWLSARHGKSRFVEVIDRIRIYRVGGRATLYPRAVITYLFRLRGRYDVIVDCENGVPFFSPLYSRVPKVLVVHHVHQEIFRTQVPRQFRWLALWLEGSFMPWLYRKTSVVAVSQGTRGDLIDMGFDPSRIQVITNGVHPSPRSADAPTPHILCMGRLTPAKSVDVLLRALPAVVAEIPDLQVDIIGQGPDRRRLERIAWSTGIAGLVRFHGYVSARVLGEVAGKAWMAVCPSSFEGWGVVCMEASSRGLPVVAADVSGLRESVRHGETGLLVPYGDESALSQALIDLVRDPQRRKEMGEAGVAWAAQHTWDQSAESFATVVAAQVHRPLPGDATVVVLPGADGEVIEIDSERRTLASRR